jgi:hypothetical protein
MSLTMSSSFCDKTFSTAAIDSGRAGSWLLNLVDTLDLHEAVLENLCQRHIYILPYLCQNRHQGRLFLGAGSADWACWSKMWSCSICLSFTSSCAWSIATICSSRCVSPAVAGASAEAPFFESRGPTGISTSHVKPWGVGCRCPLSCPLRNLRWIVSIETPNLWAASAMVRSSTSSPCVCIGILYLLAGANAA